MRHNTKMTADRRSSMVPTPFSMASLSSRQSPKQERNVGDIYLQVKQKVNQMEQAFKQEHLMKQRQLLKTFVKVLDKIGEQVLAAKWKYKNIDKQNLRTDKRLEIVTQLNEQRSKCNLLAKNIKEARKQIRRYEDENNYLEKQVEALQNIQKRKRSLSKSEKIKYRTNKKQARSLQKKWPEEFNENDPLVFVSKPSTQLSRTFDLKHQAKSFIINSADRQVQMQRPQFRTEQRPYTHQRHISNKRIRNKFIHIPLQ